MDRLDLRYICTQIGNLSGIPVRIYRDGESVFFHTTTGLPVDPALLYREQLLAVDGSVGYVSTEDFHYFGVVRTPEATIAVGPTRQIPSSEQELRDLAFRADVPREKIDAFLSGMRSIVRMPLESILQMLCVVNYVLNGEKLELRDLTIREIAASDTVRAFIESSAPVPEKCARCHWYRLCRNGCRRDRQDNLTGEIGVSCWCEAYQKFFEYAVPRIEALARHFSVTL